MIVIPCGSDTVIHHPPWITLGVAGVAALVSLVVIILHPIALLRGEPALVQARVESRWEEDATAAAAAWSSASATVVAPAIELAWLDDELPRMPEVGMTDDYSGLDAAGKVADRKELAHEVAEWLGVASASAAGRTVDEQADGQALLQRAVGNHRLDQAEQTRLSALLAASAPITWAERLRDQLHLSRTGAKPIRQEQAKVHRERIETALAQQKLTEAEASDLIGMLDKRPVARVYPRLLAELQLAGAPPKRCTEDDRANWTETLGRNHQRLSDDEREDFAKRTAGIPVVTSDFNEEMYAMEALPMDKPIGLSDHERIVEHLRRQVNDGNITKKEQEILLTELAKHRVAGDAMAMAADTQLDDVPWYLMPLGSWSWPWTWVVSALVNCHWRSLVFGLFIFVSVGLILEGMVGWRRFAPLLAGLWLGTGLLGTLGGFTGEGVLAKGGLQLVTASLLGVALMWCPFNHIHYRRWFFITLNEWEVPVWGAAAVSAVVGVLAGIGIGYPVLGVLLGFVAAPLLGAGAGWWFLRQGWVACEGWDLPTWWSTRQLRGFERTQLHREQNAVVAAAVAPEVTQRRQPGAGVRIEVGSGSGSRAAAAVDVGLAAEWEAEISADLAKGELDTALATYDAARNRLKRWVPPLPIIDLLSKRLHQAKRYDDALRCAEDAAQHHGDGANDCRLIAAGIFIRQQRRPRAGLAHLEAIPTAAIRPQHREQVDKLRAQADALIAEGVLEF